MISTDSYLPTKSILSFNEPNQFVHDEKVYASKQFNSLLNHCTYSEYEMVTTKRERLNIIKGSRESFYIVFSWESNLCVLLENKKFKTIEAFGSVLFYNQKCTGLSVTISPGLKHRFGVLSLSKASEIEKLESFFSVYKKNFLEYSPYHSSLIIANPNFKIIEKLETLSSLTHKNVGSDFLIQGLIFEIFGHKLEQIILGSEIDCKNETLNSRELKKIKALAKGICDAPSEEYNVGDLSRAVGISQCKLQDGFKILYNKTVNQYIRDVRLENAVMLMKTTDYNI